MAILHLRVVIFSAVHQIRSLTLTWWPEDLHAVMSRYYVSEGKKYKWQEALQTSPSPDHIIWLSSNTRHTRSVKSPSSKIKQQSVYRQKISEINRAVCVCVCAGCEAMGLWATLLSWDHWGTSLPLWSSGLSHTHMHKDRQTRYTWVCVCVCVSALGDGSVRVFKSDDIIVVSPGWVMSE